MKILTEEDIDLLRATRYDGMQYGEWQDWEEALEMIGHKYISEEDEYDYYECELEDMPIANFTRCIEYIERLIFEINKYHYCIPRC